MTGAIVPILTCRLQDWWRLAARCSAEVCVGDPSTWMGADMTAPLPTLVLPSRDCRPPMKHIGVVPVSGLDVAIKAMMLDVETVNLHLLSESEERDLHPVGRLSLGAMKCAPIFLPSRGLPPEIVRLAQC